MVHALPCITAVRGLIRSWLTAGGLALPTSDMTAARQTLWLGLS